MSAEVSPPPNYDTIKAYSHSKEVHRKLIDYLRTTARKTIVDDNLTLSHTLTSIEDDFATVASQLTALDEKNIMPDKFAPIWRKLHDVRRFFHKSTCMIHLDALHSGVYDAHARISKLCERCF